MDASVPIGVLLKITDKEIERRLNEKAELLGLTTAQMYALYYICRNSGQVCQRDLERKFDLTHATVSGLIARLSNKGFIVISSDSADRRKNMLLPTPKAEACTDEIRHFIRNSDPQLMNGFSEEEKTQFRLLLLRILDNLKSF